MIEKLQAHPLKKHKDFRLLFIARLISAIGDKFFLLALTWYMLNLDHPLSNIFAGLVIAVYILPTVIFGPIMGTVADRINRKTCMLLSDMLRAVLMTGLAYYLWCGYSQLGVILGFVFVITAFNPLFESGVYAAIPSLTDEHTLSEATALDSSAYFVSQLLGALLGSVTIVFIGIGGAFFFNALTFVVSFIIILAIKHKLQPVEMESKTRYTEELKAGFQFIFQRKPLFALTLFFALFNFFLSALPFIIVIIVEDILPADYWLISLDSFFALGSVLMFILLSFYNRVSKHFYRNLWIAALVMSIAFAALGLTSNGWLLSFILFISGCALAYINGTAYGLFQQFVPDAVKGRFFAILTTLCFAVMPLSYLANGILTNYFHVSQVLIVEGSIAICISLVILILPKIDISQ